MSSLAPLRACSALEYLNCSHTSISSLDPLSACALLQKLQCDHTAINSLAPLAACRSLRTLWCWNTGISCLDPVAACRALAEIACSNTAVSSLEPLSGCASLHTLHCYKTAVSSLAPLAACTTLKKLICDPKLSTDFDFMKKSKIVRLLHNLFLGFAISNVNIFSRNSSPPSTPPPCYCQARPTWTPTLQHLVNLFDAATLLLHRGGRHAGLVHGGAGGPERA